MPSKDRVDPKLNKWLEDTPGRSSVQERRPETSTATRLRSAALIRLARRLGLPEGLLLERYPEDTLRRLKYPVMEEQKEDGTIKYHHPKGAIEGPRSLTLT